MKNLEQNSFCVSLKSNISQIIQKLLPILLFNYFRIKNCDVMNTLILFTFNIKLYVWIIIITVEW